jgi:folate-binding protein YgfZ
MQPEWRAFLVDSGAVVAGDEPVRLPGDRDADANCVLFDLSHLGLLSVSGPDARDFLQGQLTNDIRELSQTHTQLSSHCSPKGRMLASFRLIQRGSTLLLQLPRERVASLLQRLRLFVLRAQVTIDDASDAIVRIGLTGNGAPALLESLGLPAPASDGAVIDAGDVSVLRLPAPAPRFELLGPFDAIRALWPGLAQASSPGSADEWALHDIRAGVPNVFDETADAFVPQMVNLQLIDGVSFHKGCYTGQEVVARMQYLGKLKRRMYVGEVAAPVRPRPGDLLTSPGSSSEQAPGRVVDARPIGNGRYALLAVVEIASAEGGEVRLGDDGPALSLEPPPYGFAADQEPVAP